MHGPDMYRVVLYLVAMVFGVAVVVGVPLLWWIDAPRRRHKQQLKRSGLNPVGREDDRVR
jgi:hypothetical protein